MLKYGIKRSDNLDYTAKVKDSLHGTILFTSLEKQVIATPEFQRLRRIGQTSFVKNVFPGATHTRFEHSLGTMHIAGLFFESLLANQKKIITSLNAQLQSLSEINNPGMGYSEKNFAGLRDTYDTLQILQNNQALLQALRLAALLHDVGHPPMSHSAECFLPTWCVFETHLESFKLPGFLKDSFKLSIENFKSKGKFNEKLRLSHEVFTLLIIASIFAKLDINNHDKLLHDVCAILDLNIIPSTESDLSKYKIQTLLHEIISGEMDADRMDYLLRDTRQCGVVYGLFDLERILGSTVFYKDSNGNSHLALLRSGLPAFEDYLRARLSMYEQVYFHKTATACQAMLNALQRELPDFSLPLNLSDYLKIDDNSFASFIKEYCKNDESNTAYELIDSLFYTRTLWKRVYEENMPKSIAQGMPSLCPAIIVFLRNEQIPCEIIENHTTLTRFVPRGRHKSSENVLRIVVKNVFDLYLIEPIENHSSLINRLDEENVIRRVYISQKDSKNQKIYPKQVQLKIASNLIAPVNAR